MDGIKVFLIILAGGAAMGTLWGLYKWLIGEPTDDPTHSPDHDSSDDYE
ncbi:hypothetical protein ATI61_102138 [Archangium gephyra]|uniref:Uncharacterized protein n=1 Tax=Archangium gephyra TaxID=48 RepID=A0AAC8TGC9_9BACT|nr:hypothetical protein [Archangium gephyra]AKJ05067.1 Hypothetical protein AA314_06693 [Archangium gephyra]REG35770.1 hypothetical protein ATI61_102138 [Archangium gephyra]